MKVQWLGRPGWWRTLPWLVLAMGGGLSLTLVESTVAGEIMVVACVTVACASVGRGT